MSGWSRAECGEIRTFVGDGLFSFVVESVCFEVILLVDVAPVMASCTAFAESLAHAGLGLGSVLDYSTGREGTFSAGHGGRSGGGDDGTIGFI